MSDFTATSKYETRVARYLEGLTWVSTGASPGCAECGLEDCDEMEGDAYECAGEPSFSWSPCEVCDSTLGGDRHPWHAMSDGQLVHGTCCTNCLMYLNGYGEGN